MILLVVFTMTGCGLSDWTYELNGGYEIWRLNSRDIQLVYRERGENFAEILINNYFVTDFSVNEGFIGVKGIPYADEVASEEDLASDTRVFYLLDVTSGELYGPFESKTEYDAKCLELSTGEMNPWKNTEGLGVEADKQKREGE